MLRNVVDGGTLQARADVVPAEAPACRMIARVPAIAGHVGHVDPADEGKLAVDHQRLLVMAVERVLPRVPLASDLGCAGEFFDGRVHLLAGRVEDRYRRAGPHQHAHVHVFSRLGEQRAHGFVLRTVAFQLEARRDVPAGDPDRSGRVLDRVRDRFEGIRAIDQDLQLAALTRGRIVLRPPALVWLERL